MKYLSNPTTGQIKATTPLEAKRLLRYGWKAISKAQYHEAKREYMAYLISRNLNHVRVH